MAESWKAENWDALIRGEDCPVCELIRLDEAEDEHGIAIADLSFSRLFLAKNQYVRGYCVLMCHRHVIEPHELTAEERAKYFDDLALVGRRNAALLPARRRCARLARGEAGAAVNRRRAAPRPHFW